MDTKQFLEEEGYTHLRHLEGKGWCGLMRMLYTVGLCYGLNEGGLDGRYCYPNHMEALSALNRWTGAGDPPGPWIKHKGLAGEWANPDPNHD